MYLNGCYICILYIISEKRFMMSQTNALAKEYPECKSQQNLAQKNVQKMEVVNFQSLRHSLKFGTFSEPDERYSGVFGD